MKPVVTGFILGFLLKEKIQHVGMEVVKGVLGVFHKVKKKKNSIINTNPGVIKSIDFVFKITDIEVFDEHFKNKDLNLVRIQPLWNYFKKKQIIKVPLDDDFIKHLNNIGEFNISFKDFFDIKNIKNNNEYYITLDIPFFESFGDVYLYITYSINDKKYINVYNKQDLIKTDDFTELDTVYKDFFDTIIAARTEFSNGRIEYLTRYLKMFVNNTKLLTPEILLNNYDKIDNDLENKTIDIITEDSETYIFTLNEYLTNLKND